MDAAVGANGTCRGKEKSNERATYERVVTMLPMYGSGRFNTCSCASIYYILYMLPMQEFYTRFNAHVPVC